MEYLLIIITVIVVLYFLARGFGESSTYTASKPAPRKTHKSEADKNLFHLNKNMGWLSERWDNLDDQKARGQLKSSDGWRFDEGTERQRERVASLGLEITKGQLNKGQYSDIIGLFEDPEEGQKEILKFFRVPLRGMTYTKARVEIEEILGDSSNREKWQNRPPARMQMEFFEFFEMDRPKKLTYDIAEKLQDDKLEELEEKEDRTLLDEW